MNLNHLNTYCIIFLFIIFLFLRISYMYTVKYDNIHPSVPSSLLLAIHPQGSKKIMEEEA